MCVHKEQKTPLIILLDVFLLSLGAGFKLCTLNCVIFVGHIVFGKDNFDPIFWDCVKNFLSKMTSFGLCGVASFISGIYILARSYLSKNAHNLVSFCSRKRIGLIL